MYSKWNFRGVLVDWLEEVGGGMLPVTSVATKHYYFSGTHWIAVGGPLVRPPSTTTFWSPFSSWHWSLVVPPPLSPLCAAPCTPLKTIGNPCISSAQTCCGTVRAKDALGAIPDIGWLSENLQTHWLE